jgi:hypothetical protein
MKKSFDDKYLALLVLAMSAMSLIISICCVIYIVNHKFVAAYIKMDTPFGAIEKSFADKEPNESNEPNLSKFLGDLREQRIAREERQRAEKLEEAKRQKAEELARTKKELELKEITEMRRRKYVEEHPELSDFVKRVILEGSHAKGMTKEQVVASLGEPNSINLGEIYEQFIYNKMYPSTIYFENGICTGD